MVTSIDPQVMPRLTFEKGKVIFREGDIGDVASVVHSGEVEIARTANGRRKVLGLIREGGMFGEMALIDGQPRMADAIATKDTTCMIVRRDLFEKKLASADPFVKGLLRIFVRNIRSMADQ